MKTLVTGAAGFIGAATARRLLEQGDEVFGLDNLNDYYEVSLKRDRLALLQPQRQFRFARIDLADRAGMEALFAAERFDRVVHLGAQAGVRHSLKAPHAYVESNIVGTLNVLEGCRHNGVAHLVYASSSSVYGAGTNLPYSVQQPAAHPVSLYAATKRANELMAHSYSSLFGLPTTGLRFFTVYGPWGRPDMALFLFARAIVDGKPIEIFNHGHHKRDFTYIDDIVAGVVGCLDRPPDGIPPLRVLNIGNNCSEQVSTLVRLLESALGRRAIVQEAARPLSDVEETFASVDAIGALTGFAPRTSLEEGIPRFAAWFTAWNGHSH